MELLEIHTTKGNWFVFSKELDEGSNLEDNLDPSPKEKEVYEDV